jgi:GDP/UDP-N,N'-diacetylbacillosamine 2-epimerase (hydrolysing)
LCIENFGKENYFNAMYYAKLLIGNTSSGIIEAASFRKYVVNVGDRQKGRMQSNNVINTTFNFNDIILKTDMALNLDSYSAGNIYFKNAVTETIINVIKQNS